MSLLVTVPLLWLECMVMGMMYQLLLNSNREYIFVNPHTLHMSLYVYMSIIQEGEL